MEKCVILIEQQKEIAVSICNISDKLYCLNTTVGLLELLIDEVKIKWAKFNENNNQLYEIMMNLNLDLKVIKNIPYFKSKEYHRVEWKYFELQRRLFESIKNIKNGN